MTGIEEAALIAGVAGTLAGTGMTIAGNEESKHAMNDVMNQQLSDQSKRSDQAMNALTETTNDATAVKAGQQQQAGAQQSLQENMKLQGMSSGASAPSAAGSGNQTGSGRIVTDTARAARQGVENQSNAQLQGYNNYALQQALNQIALKTRLGVLGSQAQSEQSVLPFKLDQAKQTGAGLSGAGQLVSEGGGVLGVLGGLGGLGSAAMAAPTAGQISALGAGFGPVRSSFVQPSLQSLYMTPMY